MKLGYSHPMHQIREALGQATCRRLGKGIYSLSRNTKVLEELLEAFGVEWDQSFARVEQLRQLGRDLVHNA